LIERSDTEPTPGQWLGYRGVVWVQTNYVGGNGSRRGPWKVPVVSLRPGPFSFELAAPAGLPAKSEAAELAQTAGVA